jgi:hypothetical protein
VLIDQYSVNFTEMAFIHSDADFKIDKTLKKQMSQEVFDDLIDPKK